ncbi:hypothetical protein Pcinc_033658 [Petrolisthes cinctipes]|uniref:Regulatory protein zeste n=1 Tax=Petrolisthes cinctipes TaxID=88211 RepID=A0AAE1JY97_PETCI|nr:hypothetical protein Pcinc_033658 [Petrolisthes cinctipes]
METPKTSKRTPNWSKDEVMMLLRLVKGKKEIIKGKFSPTLTIRHKRDAWQSITESLTVAFPACERQRDQVEKKWQNLLCKGKRDISSRKRLYNQTGGGPPAPGGACEDPVLEEIEDIVGKDNVTWDGFPTKMVTDSFSITEEAVSIQPEEIVVHISDAGGGAAADTDEDDVGPPVIPPLGRLEDSLPFVDSGIFRAGDPQDVKFLIEELKRAARAQATAYKDMSAAFRDMSAYYRSKTDK